MAGLEYNQDTIDEILTDKEVLKNWLNSRTITDDYDVSWRLFNSPFHLLSRTDPIANTKVDLGRKFVECISAVQSIVYLVPGESSYMPGATDGKKDSISEVLMDQLKGQDTDDSVIKSISDTFTGTKGQKYFDFVHNYSTYISYVNLLCRASAIFLGIGDSVGPDGETKYKNYNWHNYKQSAFAANKTDTTFGGIFSEETEITSTKQKIKQMANEYLFGDWEFIQFYADVGVTASDSLSNSTMESKLAGMLTTGTDLMKELMFLGLTNDNSIKDKVVNGIRDLFGKLTGQSKIVSRLETAAYAMAQGNNLIFPELYSGSDYSKSFTLKFNLYSPYGDKESIYLHTMVPMMHLLCFAAPRQVSGEANVSTSPFLIKAFSRGWFQCNMGMVESLSIERGNDNCWNVDGLPTSLEINMNIKDLYSDLMISKSTEPFSFFANDSLMDYLNVTCGIDILKPSIVRKLKLITAVIGGAIIDTPDKIFEKLQESFRNIFRNFVGGA